jgi:hypothetical protein
MTASTLPILECRLIPFGIKEFAVISQLHAHPKSTQRDRQQIK